MRHAALPALALIALTGGCVPPRSLSPTIEAHDSAITAIRASYERDLALLAAQLDSAIDTRRTLLLGKLDRELVERGYLDDGAPDRLRADLSDASITNPVLDDIRTGRMQLEAAEQLLADYAAAESLSDGVSRGVRDQLLEKLGAVREFDAAASILRSAMTDHAADVAWLFDESSRSADALRAYAAQSPELPAAINANAPELWSRFVLTRISDPAKRAAAESLLAQLLSFTTPTALSSR